MTTGILLCLALTACWERSFGAADDSAGDTSSDLVADVNAEEEVQGRFTFLLPDQGESIGQPRTLAVSGPGLARAQFALDGVLAAEVTEAPFEWVLDAPRLILGAHRVEITAIGGDDTRESRSRDIEIVRGVTNDEIQTAIDELPGGAWYEIPNSQLRHVGWHDPEDHRGDLADIMLAASGGAFDTQRNRLMIFGGGQSYSGNEVYAFDLPQAQWIRLTDPTPPDPADPSNEARNVAYPDGTPYARHTYDYLEYLPPPIDRLVCTGGSSVWPDGNLGDPRTWYFDPTSATWEIAATESPVSGLGAVSALAPDGRIWQHGTGQPSRLAVYDPSTRSWTSHAEWPNYFEPVYTAAIDPERNVFVAVGNDSTWIWDLDTPDVAALQVNTTGGEVVEGGQPPGLDYHPGQQRLIAWSGGTDVYALDLVRARWDRIETTGTVDPGPATERGVYGRFRYVPARDVFILSTSVDRNVFVYRLPE